MGWRQLAAAIPHALFSLFYPDQCRICGEALVRFTRAPVCPGCVAGLRPMPAGPQCARCGLPFANPAPLHGSEFCAPCRLGATRFDWARGFGAYEGGLRRMIHLLKYDGMEPLARPLAGCLVALLAEAGPVDLIVPVPLYRGRKRQRGFNQSELLARELGRLTAVPVEEGWLRRVRATRTQTGLTYRERRENVSGAFALSHPEGVAGKCVALLDDVITTGATVSACAEVLKQAGARRVVAVALVRARLRPMEPVAPLARGAAA